MEFWSVKDLLKQLCSAFSENFFSQRFNYCNFTFNIFSYQNTILKMLSNTSGGWNFPGIKRWQVEDLSIVVKSTIDWWALECFEYVYYIENRRITIFFFRGQDLVHLRCLVHGILIKLQLNWCAIVI